MDFSVFQKTDKKFENYWSYTLESDTKQARQIAVNPISCITMIIHDLSRISILLSKLSTLEDIQNPKF